MPPTTKQLLKCLVGRLMSVLIGMDRLSESSEHSYSHGLWKLSAKYENHV